MPDYVHAMIRIKPIDRCMCGLQTTPDSKGGSQTAPTNNIVKLKPLGRLVGAYKTHTTVEMNKILNTPGNKFWQRNYYERIIRNEREYYAVWEYIESNPLNWIKDEN